MSRFTGRRAVVTGGARGIGRAIAAHLAAEGATVGVLDLDLAAAEETARYVGSLAGSGGALALQADVTDDAAMRSAIDTFASWAGGIEILVNNAGITRDELFFRMTRDDWDSVLTTNLTSMYVASRAVEHHLTAARYGKIVNLSSRSALGNRGQANYAAAKAGVQGFTATLAIELGPFNVNVNAVAPGFVATEMTDATARRQGKDPEEYRAEIAARTPLQRVGRPEDIARAVAFLASDDASYISGQTLYVNGGAR